MKIFLIILYILSIFISSCDTSQNNSDDEEVFTMYRNSPVQKNARIHVSTFDSKEGKSYNSENCQRASNLFDSQAGVITRFWCEKGFIPNREIFINLTILTTVSGKNYKYANNIGFNCLS